MAVSSKARMVIKILTIRIKFIIRCQKLTDSNLYSDIFSFLECALIRSNLFIQIDINNLTAHYYNFSGDN